LGFYSGLVVCSKKKRKKKTGKGNDGACAQGLKKIRRIKIPLPQKTKCHTQESLWQSTVIESRCKRGVFDVNNVSLTMAEESLNIHACILGL
jgi:hypothetical protein